MAIYKFRRLDGSFGLVGSRKPEAYCERNGLTLIGPCDGPKEDEELDQTTGEIRKRPVVEPGPTLEQKFEELKLRVKALEDAKDLESK